MAERAKPVRVLIFGEDENDCAVVRELILSVCPHLAPSILLRKEPIILARNADRAKRIKNAEKVRAVVRAEQVRHRVACVFIHHDADKPDDESGLADDHRAMEDEYAFEVGVHAVIPAWETEAWLCLFPKALASFRESWAAVKWPAPRAPHTKEALKRATAKTARPYSEADAPGIARRARERDDVNDVKAKLSPTFDRLRAAILACCEAAR